MKEFVWTLDTKSSYMPRNPWGQGSGDSRRKLFTVQEENHISVTGELPTVMSLRSMARWFLPFRDMELKQESPKSSERSAAINKSPRKALLFKPHIAPHSIVAGLSRYCFCAADCAAHLRPQKLENRSPLRGPGKRQEPQSTATRPMWRACTLLATAWALRRGMKRGF